MDLAAVLRVLRRADGEVAAVYRTGSRVYGTASATSDEDFVAVLARRRGLVNVRYVEHNGGSRRRGGMGPSVAMPPNHRPDPSDHGIA
jgi:hypothetical protein